MNLKKYIDKIITEEVRKVRLSELNLSVKEYEKFIDKVERDGTSKSGTYNGADPTGFTKTECSYQVENKLFRVNINDVTWGAEIKIELYLPQSTEINTSGGVYVDYDTGTPQNKKNKQIIQRDKNPQFVISSIYEIMKNGRKISFNDWLRSTNKNEIKESSSQEEVESLAVDLIDYMGKELPPRPNPRIMRWFQESGITDAKLIQQIYQTALKLNRE